MSIQSNSRQLFTVDETCEQLHLSKPVFYQLIKSGRLCSITIGRARRIPLEAVEQYVHEEIQAQQAYKPLKNR